MQLCSPSPRLFVFLPPIHTSSHPPINHLSTPSTKLASQTPYQPNLDLPAWTQPNLITHKQASKHALDRGCPNSPNDNVRRGDRPPSTSLLPEIHQEQEKVRSSTTSSSSSFLHAKTSCSTSTRAPPTTTSSSGGRGRMPSSQHNRRFPTQQPQP